MLLRYEKRKKFKKNTECGNNECMEQASRNRSPVLTEKNELIS